MKYNTLSTTIKSNDADHWVLVGSLVVRLRFIPKVRSSNSERTTNNFQFNNSIFLFARPREGSKGNVPSVIDVFFFKQCNTKIIDINSRTDIMPGMHVSLY